ncbi:MAG: hypothetical protein LBJ08_01525 [Bifidobacteriaceae bacterium]|nr:hypothetical protein [Bifidobacteriaceae bacterium]
MLHVLPGQDVERVLQLGLDAASGARRGAHGVFYDEQLLEEYLVGQAAGVGVGPVVEGDRIPGQMEGVVNELAALGVVLRQDCQLGLDHLKALLEFALLVPQDINGDSPG